MREKDKLSESNALIDREFKIMKIIKVNTEYKRNIFIACLNTSELFSEI